MCLRDTICQRRKGGFQTRPYNPPLRCINFMNSLSEIITILKAVHTRIARRTCRVRFIFFVLSFTAACVLYVLCDIALRFPDELRICIVYATAGTFMCVLIGNVIRTCFTHPHYEDVARIVQARYPVLRDDVSNIISLARSTSYNSAITSYCMDRAERTVHRSLASVVSLDDFSKNPYARIQRIACGVIITCALLTAVCFPHASQYAVLRVIYPSSYLEKIGTLSVQPGNVACIHGTHVCIAAAVSTHLDTPPVLVYKTYHGSWHRVQMDVSSSNTYTYRFVRVRKPITYYVSTHALSSPRYHISVVPPPLISNLRVYCFFPQYTRIKDPVISDTSDINVLRGTRIRVTATVNAPITHALLRYGLHTVPMKQTRSLIEATFVVDHAGEYCIEAYNALGARNTPQKHSITLVPDALPTVAIVSPTGNALADIHTPLQIRYTAHDEFGVTRVVLVYQINKGKEQRIELLGWQGWKDIDTVFSLPLENHGIKAGDTVTLYFEVFDGATVLHHALHHEQTNCRISLREEQWLSIRPTSTASEPAQRRQQYGQSNAVHLSVVDLRALQREQDTRVAAFGMRMEQMLAEQQHVHTLTSNALNKNAAADKALLRSIAKEQEHVCSTFETMHRDITEFCAAREQYANRDTALDRAYRSIADDMAYVQKTTIALMRSQCIDLQSSPSFPAETMAALQDEQRTLTTYLRTLAATHKTIRERIEQQKVITSLNALRTSYAALRASMNNPAALAAQSQAFAEKIAALQERIAAITAKQNKITQHATQESLDLSGLTRDHAQLQDAIQRGDMKTAQQYIHNMQAKLEVLTRYASLLENSVATAHTTRNASHSASSSRALQLLTTMIASQEALATDTRICNDKRIALLLEKQRHAMPVIVSSYRDIEHGLTEKTNALAKQFTENTSHYYLTALQSIARELRTLNAANDASTLLTRSIEFRASIRTSEEVFRDARNQLLDIFDEQAKAQQFRQASFAVFSWFEDQLDLREERIDALAVVLPKEYNAAFTKKIAALARAQKQVKQRTQQLRNLIHSSPSQSVARGHDIVIRLDQTLPLMDTVVIKLTRTFFDDALAKETDVLNILYGIRDMLNEDSAAARSESLAVTVQPQQMSLSEFYQQATVQQATNATTRAVREGYIIFPNENDYKVPQQYREEITASSKEKKPKGLERLIDEYYRRISAS